MTATEKFVSDLCKRTFLSFWSFPNPIGKKLDKELCDILVVCEPDIIIFSVKEINVKDSGNYDVDLERWERNAIQESVKQLYGAERFISKKEEILLNDGTTVIKLPEKSIRNIYRVAVAFGRGENFPLKFGEFGKGYVHVFDEQSIHIVLQELDTITDFIDFLKAKEHFIAKGINHISYSEEDYLGMYLLNNFQIDQNADLVFLDGELWENYSKSQEYLHEKRENEISYIWDGIIENVCKHFESDTLLDEIRREELELSLRLMNRESRLGRKLMCKLLMDVLGLGQNPTKIKARIVYTGLDDAPLYVVMKRSVSDRDFAKKELALRCIVAKSLFPHYSKVIGIASENIQKGKDYCVDLVYLDLTHWTAEDQKEAEDTKEELGFFKRPDFSKLKPDGTIAKEK